MPGRELSELSCAGNRRGKQGLLGYISRTCYLQANSHVWKHTHTECKKWVTRLSSSHVSFFFDWQVIADTNISAIASQVENLSTGSAPSTNPEVRPVEPEWVTSVSTNHTAAFRFLLLAFIMCVVCYFQGAQAERHHTGERLRGTGVQYRGGLRESTWRSSYLCQNSLQQGNFPGYSVLDADWSV